ncbi:hypothetical protein HY26_04260 [Hyphomonas sp. GM-8P]|nr:hypothetical protein HY26_04260 [Hyphomonas sp. GM-8P]
MEFGEVIDLVCYSTSGMMHHSVGKENATMSGELHSETEINIFTVAK